MILMTGSSGTIGSVLLQRLRAAGEPVRATYRSPEATKNATRDGYDAVTVDLDAPDTLREALDGVRAVFLLGAMGPRQSDQELAVVVAARAAGVERIVKLSVWRAAEQLSPIARLHRPVEEALERSGLAWTFLRPNFYMQNFLRQAGAEIRATGEFAQPAMRTPISFIDTRDIAAVAYTVLTSDGHDGQAYALTGPEALTYEQAAATLSEVLQRPVRFVALDDDQARQRMLSTGLPLFYADALIEVARAFRDGGVETVTPTVGELTGRQPVSFARFASDHRGAFLSED